MLSLDSSRRQCRLIFTEGWRYNKSRLIFGQGKSKGINKLCRTVAAEYPFIGHFLIFCETISESAAVGIRVSCTVVYCLDSGIFHRLRNAVRIDIGREIQNIFMSINIAAMRIIFIYKHTVSLLFLS